MIFVIFSLGCIFITPLGDKFGRWIVLAIAMPVTVITTSLTIDPPSLTVLCVSLVLFAVFSIVRISLVVPFMFEFSLNEEKILRICTYNSLEGLLMIITAFLLQVYRDTRIIIGAGVVFTLFITILYFVRSEESPDFYR